MNIIRIIEITDTGRLAKELRKEGWTPDTDETGRWRKDGTVFRLTDSGFHAYIGPDEQCPPFDDIDMLEPVDHGIYEIPGKGDAESHACTLLAHAAYQKTHAGRSDPRKSARLRPDRHGRPYRQDVAGHGRDERIAIRPIRIEMGRAHTPIGE